MNRRTKAMPRIWGTLAVMLLAITLVRTSTLHAQPGICCDLIVDIGSEVRCAVTVMPNYFPSPVGGASILPGSHYVFSVPCPNSLTSVSIIDSDGSVININHFNETYFIPLNDATCCVQVRLFVSPGDGCYHLAINGYSPCP